MLCVQCGGEANPINIEQSIYECLKCGHRQHVHFPGVLNVDDLPIQPAAESFKEVPRAAQTLFEIKE